MDPLSMKVKTVILDHPLKKLFKDVISFIFFVSFLLFTYTVQFKLLCL